MEHGIEQLKFRNACIPCEGEFTGSSQIYYETGNQFPAATLIKPMINLRPSLTVTASHPKG